MTLAEGDGGDDDMRGALFDKVGGANKKQGDQDMCGGGGRVITAYCVSPKTVVEGRPRGPFGAQRTRK